MKHADPQRRLARYERAFILLWLLLVGLLAWFGERLDVTVDLTAAGRHSLTAQSEALLGRLVPPPEFTLYARPGPARRPLERLLQRYPEAHPGLTLTLVDPDLEPERTRAAEVAHEGELQISWQGRHQSLSQIDEQTIANALQRLLRGGQRQLHYLSGHGERSLQGGANFDLGSFGQLLATQGFSLAPLPPATPLPAPHDGDLLLVAAPQLPLLPGELTQLQEYLAAGGNLLWLLDPGPLHGLEALAEPLALRLPGGQIDDPAAARLGIRLPGVCVVTTYAHTPPTATLTQAALLIGARPVLPIATPPWQATPLFSTADESRLQLGSDDATSMPGPFPLAVALSRPRAEGGTQRVVVVGDGDFLSNSYLGNQGNQPLGLALVDWLSDDSGQLVSLEPHHAPDQRLELGPNVSALLGLLFLILLPLGLFLGGLRIWRRRRNA